MGLFDSLFNKGNTQGNPLEQKQEPIKDYSPEPKKKIDEPILSPIRCNPKIHDELDDQQLKAVESPLGNTCVFAIAGSGKTRVLTYRVANLIDNGYKESEMMLLTFTNKAADEMTDRIKVILNKDKLNLISGTFHSVASSFLREYAKEIGYNRNFKIITPGIQKALIESCRNEYLEKYMSGFNNEEFPSKNVIADIYSGAINHDLTFREYIKQYYSYYRNDTPDGIILILKDYVERKNKDNLMDFDDLLLNFMDLLSIPSVRKKICKKYKYIFVDEYQDINWMQYQILEYLNQNNTMFVIGDSKQCIYQFRGSRPEYIDIFKNTHKYVFDFSLTYNYRSTPEILKMAEDVISHNDYQNKTKILTKNPEAELPLIIGCNTEIQEVQEMINIIKDKKFDLNETAILVRRGAQVAIIEQLLKKEGIPYNLIGNVSMYESEHIQDIIAFLQLIDDKSNEAAFYRTIRLFSGIGATYADSLYKKLKINKFDYQLTLTLTSGRQNYALSVLNRIITYPYKDISHMVQYIINTFYQKYAQNKYPDYEDRMEDVRYFLIQAKDYDDITNFLDDVITTKKEDKRKQKNCLTVITMHKAKGLEWDNVFIPFVDKGEYPRCKDKEFLQNTENVKNERNLFYVAITRAKKNLYLSYSLYYTDKPAGPSPFLEEMDEDVYDADFVADKKD